MSAEIPEGFPITLPREALAGLDGLEDEGRDTPVPAPAPGRALTLSAEAAERVRYEIARAGGREVCFLADVDGDRVVHGARAVARGNFDAVLVAARDAAVGSVMLHNHPSGVLEPSDADMHVAGHLYGGVRTRARELAVEHDFPMEPHQRFDMAKVSQFLVVRHSRELARRAVAEQLESGIRERQGELAEGGKIYSAAVEKCLGQEDDPMRILAELPARVFITASHDPLLLLALRQAGREPKPLYSKWRKTRDNHPKEPPYDGRATSERPVVLHAFGVDKKDDRDSLVLTEDDFLDYLIAAADYKLIPTAVRGQLVKSSLLFLGFPLHDLAFRVLFRLIMSLDGSSQLADHAHVGVQVDPEEHSLADVKRAREYLADYFQTGAGAPRIDIYWGTAADFLKELRKQLDAAADSPASAAAEEEEDVWDF